MFHTLGPNENYEYQEFVNKLRDDTHFHEHHFKDIIREVLSLMDIQSTILEHTGPDARQVSERMCRQCGIWGQYPYHIVNK